MRRRAARRRRAGRVVHAPHVRSEGGNSRRLLSLGTPSPLPRVLGVVALRCLVLKWRHIEGICAHTRTRERCREMQGGQIGKG